MIRDPSDGSVREKPVDQTAVNRPPYANKLSPDKDLIASTTSGLPLGSTKPENLARLEKSREWLRQYRRGQE